MASAEQLYTRWKRATPKEAKANDVRKVAEHYFPGEISSASSGSHSIIIRGPTTEYFYRAQSFGYSAASFLDGPTFTISVVGGKKVKKLWVERLVKLIDLKIELDETNRGKE